MAYQKAKKQPTFSELKAILAQTHLDNATYQTIEMLIDKLSQFQSIVNGQIDDIIRKASAANNGNNGNNGGGSTGPTVPLPHAQTHLAGGTDPIDGIAWVAQNNQFTGVNVMAGGTTRQFEIQGSIHPALTMRNTSQVANERVARLVYYQKILRFNFTTDDESLLVGHEMTFSRDTGNLDVGGSVITRGELNVLGNASVLNFYDPNSAFDRKRWRFLNPNSGSLRLEALNDANNTNLAVTVTFNRDGTTNFGGQINAPSSNISGNSYASGWIEGSDVIARTSLRGGASSGEAAYFSRGGWVRTHWIDQSQATDQQYYTIMNWTGKFVMCPTSLNGNQPVGSDWEYSLSINRSGLVTVGYGGFTCNKLTNGQGLAHGEWTPVDVGNNGGATGTASWLPARWMRVGNTWHMSGQVDVNANGGGQVAWFRCYLPSYYLFSWLNRPGTGIVTNAFGDAGYCNIVLNNGHVDMLIKVTNAGVQGFFYQITWAAG